MVKLAAQKQAWDEMAARLMMTRGQPYGHLTATGQQFEITTSTGSQVIVRTKTPWEAIRILKNQQGEKVAFRLYGHAGEPEAGPEQDRSMYTSDAAGRIVQNEMAYAARIFNERAKVLGHRKLDEDGNLDVLLTITFDVRGPFKLSALQLHNVPVREYHSACKIPGLPGENLNLRVFQGPTLSHFVGAMEKSLQNWDKLDLRNGLRPDPQIIRQQPK